MGRGGLSLPDFTVSSDLLFLPCLVLHVRGLIFKPSASVTE